MRLYYAPRTRAKRVRWVLEVRGQNYELVELDLASGEHRDAGYLRINPAGKVPSLVDGDIQISESAAICLYLGDRFPDPWLAPRLDDPQRAQYLQWSFYAVGQIEPAMADRARRLDNEPWLAWESEYRVRTILSEHLSEREWMLGDRFSIADVLVGSMLLSGADQDGLAENPLLKDCDRLRARPELSAAQT